MNRHASAVICFLLLLGAQSAWAQEARKEVAVEKDIVYGKGGEADLQLDLAVPAEGTGPFPAVLFIHGGGWKSGNRQSLTQTIQTFAAKGYVAATVTYRLAPTSKFPAQIEDCKACVRWLRSNAKKHKIDPERIGTIGFSAGAHLACMLGVCDKNDGLEGAGGNADVSSRVQAVVSYFGPTDLTKNRTEATDSIYLIPFLGATFEEKAEAYKRASPINYVTADDPPFLFFHGSEDKLVSPDQSKIMDEKLRKIGIASKLIVLEGEGHGWRGPKLVQTIEQTLTFLDERLKGKK